MYTCTAIFCWQCTSWNIRESESTKYGYDYMGKIFQFRAENIYIWTRSALWDSRELLVESSEDFLSFAEEFLFIASSAF